MSDGYDDDSEGKDTQVLPKDQAPPLDLEGTVEMDREALFREVRERTASESNSSEEPRGDRAATVQMESVDASTAPSRTSPMPAVEDATQNFQVPDSVMQSLRDDQDMHTLDIPLEAIDEAKSRVNDAQGATTVSQSDQLVEFASVIDENGRILVPASKLMGKIGPGSRVVVVMRLLDE